MCGNPRPLSGMKIKCLCQSGVVFSAHKALWKTQESLSILQSLFYDLGQIFRSCHECLLWDCMEDLTKAAMWRAAAIFRFRIQKNYCGMILILQVLLCNYLSCLSDRLQDTSGEISKITLHHMSCLAILSSPLVCVQQEIWVKLHKHDETRSNSWLKHV